VYKHTTMKDNKLIAEFMGVDIIPLEQFVVGVQSTIARIKIGRKDYICPMIEGYLLEHLQYHTSWDWLMPVVEKIFGLAVADENIELFYDVQTHIPDKTATYNAVVEFINEHNKYICGSCREHCSEYTYSEDRDVDECNNCKTYNNGQQ